MIQAKILEVDRFVSGCFRQVSKRLEHCFGEMIFVHPWEKPVTQASFFLNHCGNSETGGYDILMIWARNDCFIPWKAKCAGLCGKQKLVENRWGRCSCIFGKIQRRLMPPDRTAVIENIEAIFSKMDWNVANVFGVVIPDGARIFAV